ncbi:MAG: cell division protein FtsK [Planctomycetes bacterium]|nr:cell division protein FtsK [Planctomycetota bacterium]
MSSEAPKASVGKITPVRRPWIAAGLGLACILCLVALMDYDPGNVHEAPPAGETHLLGALGEMIARHLFGILGVVAWLLPWLFCTAAFLVATETSKAEKLRKLITLSVIILSLSTLASLTDASTNSPPNLQLYEHGRGGSLGKFLYLSLLAKSLGSLGAGLFLGLALVWSLFLHLSIQPSRAFAGLVGAGKGLKERLPAKNEKSDAPAKTPKAKTKDSENPTDGDDARPKKGSLFGREKEEDILFGAVGLDQEGGASFPATTKPKKKSKKKPAAEDNGKGSAQKEDEGPEIFPADAEEEEKEKEDDIGGFKVVRAAKTEKAANLFPERQGDYHFPTLDLLMDPPEEDTGGDEDHMSKALKLKETLYQFKIEVELGEVHTGPVITRYDIHPAAGVKVAKIATLEKDLAMALKAESVRILAPVPGKGCVGIEVPNDTSSPVCLKEILESKAWAESEAEIPIVLGKVASGKPLVADLSKMPHLLVAGATGSGKTVCINTIIASLCYHSSPDDVRFIMVDPKIVEMKIYNALPHMLIPVVTEPKKVPGALKWLLIEMERRYQIFSKVGARNIAGFNAKILKDKEEKEKALALEAEMTPEERAAISSIEVPRDDDALEIPENKLPYIVFFIDELADLMMVAQAEVETGIARLAQLARASGIHLIIATQRPSVNVITGVIKANLPSRISFRVASFRDSQTILDAKGAETLIGRGDMLFIPPGSPVFLRAQGAFVSDEEINGIVEYLKCNGPPEIIEEVREQVEAAGEEDILGQGDGDGNEDPMLKRAVEIIRTTKRASTSNLQRKLSIGYNRAARIMDELEDRGIVGPDNGSQGREILVDL